MKRSLFFSATTAILLSCSTGKAMDDSQRENPVHDRLSKQEKLMNLNTFDDCFKAVVEHTIQRLVDTKSCEDDIHEHCFNVLNQLLPSLTGRDISTLYLSYLAGTCFTIPESYRERYDDGPVEGYALCAKTLVEVRRLIQEKRAAGEIFPDDGIAYPAYMPISVDPTEDHTTRPAVHMKYMSPKQLKYIKEVWKEAPEKQQTDDEETGSSSVSRRGRKRSRSRNNNEEFGVDAQQWVREQSEEKEGEPQFPCH